MKQVKKSGVYPVRMSTTQEIHLLKQAYEQFKDTIKDKQNISWVNIYFNKTYISQSTICILLDKFVDNLVKEIFSIHMYTISYGFLLNPKTNIKYQEWHYDMTPETYVLFIPLVELNTGNSIQYIKQDIKSDGIAYEGIDSFPQYYGFDDNKILERQGLTSFQIAQIVCKPFTILNMVKKTLHRGIGNLSDIDRPMFYIALAPQHFMIYENTVQRYPNAHYTIKYRALQR